MRLASLITSLRHHTSSRRGRGLVQHTQDDRESDCQEGGWSQSRTGIEDWHRGRRGRSRGLDIRSRVHWDRGRRRVHWHRGRGGDRDGSGVGGRKNDRDIGRGAGRREHEDLSGRRHDDDLGGRRDLDDLRARDGLVSVVGARSKLGVRAIGYANVVTSGSVFLVAHARTAGAMGLAVSASAELDGRTTGDTDVETGGGILLAVTSGGSSIVGLVTTEKRETALV